MSTRPVVVLGGRPWSNLGREDFPYSFENWFGIITRQSIRRGTFASVKALIGRIRDYITHWNSHAEPFVWTATTDKILAKVLITQTNIKKLVENNQK